MKTSSNLNFFCSIHTGMISVVIKGTLPRRRAHLRNTVLNIGEISIIIKNVICVEINA